MTLIPDFSSFSELARTHNAIPVFRKLLSDSLTPVSAFRKIDRGGTACLFESVIGGEKVGRYSILAADPKFEVSARGNEVTLSKKTDGEGDTSAKTWQCDNPLEEIRKHILSLIHISEPTRPY